MNSAVYSPDLLFSLSKDGQPLEDYEEEFFEHLVSWSNDNLKTIFWSGLDDPLFQQLPAGTTTFTLEWYFEFALWLSGSSLNTSNVSNNISTTQSYQNHASLHHRETICL